MSFIEYLKENLNESVFDQHQVKIALKTLKMHKVGASIMGGMNHKEAVKVLRKNGYSNEKIEGLLSKAGHDKEDIKKFSEAYEEEELETTMDEPDYENDCFITDAVNRGYSVSCAGKYLGNFIEMDKALTTVEDWKKKNNYYPTTWFVSDHGNLWPIDKDGNEIKV